LLGAPRREFQDETFLLRRTVHRPGEDRPRITEIWLLGATLDALRRAIQAYDRIAQADSLARRARRVPPLPPSAR
jgi:hypothetical protein